MDKRWTNHCKQAHLSLPQPTTPAPQLTEDTIATGIIIQPVNPTPQSPALDTSESTIMCSPTTDQDTIAPQLATNTVAITTQISTPQKETSSPQNTQRTRMDTTTTTKRKKNSPDPEKNDPAHNELYCRQDSNNEITCIYRDEEN